MSSIIFGINNQLLNYLNNEGKYLLEDVELTRSEILQRFFTIKIGHIFSNLPFYLSIHADWRGRLYTKSFFISSHSSDLSSSLLEFWDGEILNDSGLNYLYISGANNHNQNNISKKSYIDRINWVKTKYNKIINLDKGLISTADSKFIFAAFCLVIRELHKNPKSKIKLPIFLDATCSGIQHFAALLKDLELGSKVNLIPQEETDEVGDIYNEITDPINRAINKYGEDNPEYFNLSMIKLTRKILKISIMTKYYNVTNYGIANQLKEKLTKIKKDNKFIYNAPGSAGINIYLNSKEIMKMS